MSDGSFLGYTVGILVVDKPNSDSNVSKLIELLNSRKHFRVLSIARESATSNCLAIQKVLRSWSDDDHLDLILTIGGCGLSEKDLIPDATAAVLDRVAPHIATAMVMNNAKSSDDALLSRPRCGTRRQSLILNLPGNPEDCVKNFEFVAPVLPHAMDQLNGRSREVASHHSDVLGDKADRTLRPPKYPRTSDGFE